MPWRPAASVFHGGTEQIKSLKNRRVRTRTPLLQVALNEPTARIPRTTSLPAGSIGLVAGPHLERQDELLVVFPIAPHALPPTIDRCVRPGTFQVGIFNAPTFRHQFEIEDA